jgi:two-component system sensor histidine kinase PilS (NtrC family)
MMIKGFVLAIVVGGFWLLDSLGVFLFSYQTDPLVFRLSSLLFLIDILGIYALNHVQKKQEYLNVFIYTQFSIDLIFCGILVSMSNDLDSPFLFLFSVYVLIGALLRSADGAWFNALFGIAVICVITLRSILSLSFDRLSIDSGLLIRELIIKGLLHSGSLSIIALSGSYLSEQLKKTSNSLDETQNDLKELQNLHSHIIEEMNMGLMFCDDQDHILMFNQKALIILGLNTSHLLGQSLGDCLKNPLLNKDDGLLQSTQWQYQRDSDQKLRILEGQRTSYQGKTSIFVFQDITEKKRIEAELIKEQHLSKIGQLAAQIAHEIRNPLTAMSSGIELLKSQQLSAEKNQKLITIIDQEIQRLTLLISEFLKYAKPQELDKKTIKLKMLLSEIQTLNQNLFPDLIQLHLHQSLEDTEVQIDLNSMKQVFFNLINNSQEAHATQIEIDIIPSEHDHQQIHILIQDNGDGFKGDQQRLFEPFFSNKAKGSGLGLAISLKLIQANAGELSMLPSSKKGCLFCISLPILPRHKG